MLGLIDISSSWAGHDLLSGLINLMQNILVTCMTRYAYIHTYILSTHSRGRFV